MRPWVLCSVLFLHSKRSRTRIGVLTERKPQKTEPSVVHCIVVRDIAARVAPLGVDAGGSDGTFRIQTTVDDHHGAADLGRNIKEYWPWDRPTTKVYLLRIKMEFRFDQLADSFIHWLINWLIDSVCLIFFLLCSFTRTHVIIRKNVSVWTQFTRIQFGKKISVNYL